MRNLYKRKVSYLISTFIILLLLVNYNTYGQVSLTNTCPATTVDLTTHVSSTPPAGTSVVWYTNSTHTGTAYATPAAAGAGTYYSFYYDATNNCYSPASAPVTVTITTCAVINVSNTCPSNSVNLTTHVTSTPPAGTVIEWHTVASNPSAGTLVSTPSAVTTSGTYYAYYHDVVNGCYSPSSTGVAVTINTCPPLALTNTCPATTVDLTTHVSAAPSGTSVVWYTNNTHTGTVYATPAAATAGTYYAFYYDAINNCYSPVSNPVTVTISVCPPLIVTNSCPASTVNLTTHVSAAPSGTSVVWYTNNTHTGTVYATPAAAVAGTYYAFYYDAVNNCYSPASQAIQVQINICTQPDINTGNINKPIPGNLSTNDAPGGTYSSPVLTGSPSGSTPVLTLNPDGTYTFQADKPGVYSYDIKVCKDGVCVTTPLVITLTDPSVTNNPPVVNTDIVGTLVNTAVTYPVKANDGATDAGQTLGTPTIATAPAHGTAVVNGDGTITYTPATGFVGRDSLKYQVCEVPGGLCGTAWMYITVNPAGAANSTNAADDYVSTAFGTAVTGNVKTNDVDLEGNTQTVTAQNVTNSYGTFVLSSSGGYTYTPAAGFSGTAVFPYTTCDNGTPSACATASVYIVVAPSIPDFTPTIDIDVLTFASAGVSKDFVVSVFEQINNPSAGPVVVKIAKLSAFDITYNASTASSNVYGGTPVNNSDWTITQNAQFITCTLKPGVTISGYGMSSIGLTVTRKAGVPANTSQTITAIIVNASGGDTVDSNNTYGTSVTAQ